MSASEPDYDKTYSENWKVTPLRPYELTEEDLRRALDDVEELEIGQLQATIAVIGEQKYLGLAEELKRLYQKAPDDANTHWGKRLFATGSPYNYLLKTYIARALIRCGDETGVDYALELAINLSDATLVTSAAYSLRTLKYIVKEFGLDISAELELIITRIVSEEPRINHNHMRFALTETAEISKYVETVQHPTRTQYSGLVTRLQQNLPSPWSRRLDQALNGAPKWRVTQSLHTANNQ